MNHEEQALVREIVRDVLRAELPELLAHRPCLIESAGVTLDEHKEHHRLTQKFLSDLGSTRKAFIMGVVTTVTGGVFGLIWLYLKTKCGDTVPWLK